VNWTLRRIHQTPETLLVCLATSPADSDGFLRRRATTTVAGKASRQPAAEVTESSQRGTRWSARRRSHLQSGLACLSVAENDCLVSVTGISVDFAVRGDPVSLASSGPETGEPLMQRTRAAGQPGCHQLPACFAPVRAAGLRSGCSAILDMARQAGSARRRHTPSEIFHRNLIRRPGARGPAPERRSPL
jgi:hypothetical protein